MMMKMLVEVVEYYCTNNGSEDVDKKYKAEEMRP
jgi:hypothetical protein